MFQVPESLQRVFSTAGDPVTAQRSTLASEHLDQLLLHYTHQLKHICFIMHKYDSILACFFIDLFFVSSCSHGPLTPFFFL